jgi:hypothetical protein
MDISRLQQLIFSGVWRNSPVLVMQIVDRFIEIRELQFDLDESEFGTVEFWDAYYEHRENGIAPEPSSIFEWQQLVESEFWIGQPEIIERLFQQYEILIAGQQDRSSFGTLAFWDAIGGILNFENDDDFLDANDDVQDENDWILASEYEQRGDGIPIVDDDGSLDLPASHFYQLDPMFKKTNRQFQTGCEQHNLQ